MLSFVHFHAWGWVGEGGEITDRCHQRSVLMNKVGFEMERKCLHTTFLSFCRRLSFFYMKIYTCCSVLMYSLSYLARRIFLKFLKISFFSTAI